MFCFYITVKTNTQTNNFVRRKGLEGTFPQILHTCYYISICVAGGSVPLPSPCSAKIIVVVNPFVAAVIARKETKYPEKKVSSLLNDVSCDMLVKRLQYH